MIMFTKLKHHHTLPLFALQLLLFHQINAFGGDPPSTSSTLLYDKMFDAINRLSQQMEMFNVHYITKLDEKFVTIMQILSGLDANVKQLQERSQAWETFSYHMTTWNDYIKSSDQKMEIVKKNLENLPIIENQLQNTDFKIQHIFDKTDLINEKFHDLTKSMLSASNNQQQQQQMQNSNNKMLKKSKPTSSCNVKLAAAAKSQEDFENTEILLRLSKIQRMLQNTCSAIRLDREFESNNNNNNRLASNDAEDSTVAEMKSLISQINSNIEKFPSKEIKQTLNLNRKHEKALETLIATVNHIDERTIRIFDTNSYQYKKLLSNFKSTEGEVLTFTNNANILLKKVESVIKTAATIHSPAPPSQQIHENIVGEDENENSTQWNEVIADGGGGPDSNEVDDDIMDQKEYVQPNKTNCFELTTGNSGVYLFGSERLLNDGGRDFMQQYCEYSTEGTAWTVIQRRDNFEVQENFNRSWDEYKHGFGNLLHDFWFGNEFIHSLTSRHSMVLRIVIEDFKDNHVWIEYGTFKMEDENARYKLIIDEYRGAVADSMLDLNQCGFNTFDRFNISNCSTSLLGWWSNIDGCVESNLNGVYRNEPSENNSSLSIEEIGDGGIFWKNWLGNSPLKATKMMVRPKDVWFSSGNGSNEDYTHSDDF